jgi:uncharacterized membrane protein
MTMGWSHMSRTLKAVLIASLALNFLIIGAVGGWMYKWHRHGGPWHGHGGIERQLFKFARELPRQRRYELRKMFRNRWKEMRPKPDHFRDVRDSAVAALLAEPYDKQNLTDALEMSRIKRGQLMDGFSGLFVEMVDQLTVDERKAFATFLKERSHGPRRHRWRRHHE